jgi:hypothetical protein
MMTKHPLTNPTSGAAIILERVARRWIMNVNHFSFFTMLMDIFVHASPADFARLLYLCLLIG